MVRYKLNSVVFLWLVLSTNSEDTSTNAENRISVETKESQKFQLHNDNEPSFMSKLASWIFPFGNSEEKRNDLAPAAGSFGGLQYLPPPSSLGYVEKDCNPCDQVPWIPVVPYGGHKTFINVIPSHDHYNEFSSHISDYNGIDSLTPSSGSLVPNRQYGIPLDLSLKIGHSVHSSLNGVPSNSDILIADYMLPPPVNFKIPSNLYGPPQSIYGPPSQQSYGPSLKPVYGPPPKAVYGPPPNSLYGPPTKPVYGPPPKPKPQYGPPPKPDYGAPPKPQYGPPPKPIYGPPPKPTYGPPPKPQYGPPPKPIYGSPPKPVYGPPPKPVYGPPPRPVYGPPPKPEYGPPPKPEYGPPPKPVYGPPLKPDYGSPTKPEYEPPIKPDYGPPPKPEYGPPTKPIYGPPAPNYGPPPQNYGAPAKPNYGQPQHGGPEPSYVIPPPILSSQNSAPSDNYGFSNSFNRPSSLGGNYVPLPPGDDLPLTYPSTFVDENTNRYVQPAVPSDSYGAPVTGDNLEYVAALDSVPVPSGDSVPLDRPIPFPNLSSLPIVPLYNFKNFQQGFHSKSLDYKQIHEKANNIEVQPSIKIADYLASIEHPINVIQSPLVEVSVNEQSDQHYQESTNPNSHNENKSYREAIDEQNFGNLNSNVNLYNSQVHRHEHQHETSYGTLHQQPIFVEDIHTAASDINNTIANNSDGHVKRNNDKHLGISSFENNISPSSQKEQNQVKADLIKKFLNDQGVLDNPETEVVATSKIDRVRSNDTFTRPLVDYVKWEPTHASNTSKHIQIIVPYTNNKKAGFFEKEWSLKNQANFNPPKSKEGYTTLLPVYTPPISTEESLWSKFVQDFKRAENNRITASGFSKPTTAVYNIKDILSKDNSKSTTDRLPYDIISLQKNINEWTQQSFSVKTAGIETKTATFKEIPSDYLTTQPFNIYSEVTTSSNDIFEHDSAGSSNEESVLRKQDDVETNLIIAAETTTGEPILSTTPSSLPSVSQKQQRSLWDLSHVTESPRSKEKVYVVTPQTYSFFTSTPATAWSMAPKVENGTVNNDTYNTHKFSVRIEPQGRTLKDFLKIGNNNAVKVVYSEWPHLVNRLQTTTIKPTTRHPLFGLMDIPEYTPPPNSTVETFLGHSRVATVITPGPVGDKNVETTTTRTPKSI